MNCECTSNNYVFDSDFSLNRNLQSKSVLIFPVEIFVYFMDVVEIPLKSVQKNSHFL